MNLHNLFAHLNADAECEQLYTLLNRPGLKIERIVSTGQASPPGFWYEQEQGEWLVLLAGEAKLVFEDEASPRDLLPGDFVDIPPRCRHRVEWTDPEVATVWLVVYYN
jgi:cupin 2 domain-containing protein